MWACRSASPSPGPACASASWTRNEATLGRIGRGEMPFRETGADELLLKILPTGRLALSSDPATMRFTDTVIVVIGTPIDEFMSPSMSIFDRTVDELAPNLRDGALVVLRSTVFPGTTERVAERLRRRGCNVDVAFCPERIAEGHALEELTTLPQIVGADDTARRRPGRGALPARWPATSSARRPARRSWPSCSRTPGAT